MIIIIIDCESLRLETDEDFDYQGVYYKQSYTLNGHYWWKSSYLGTIIAYDSGDSYWYVATESDQSLLLIEQTSKDTNVEEYYPPDGSYYLAYTEETVTVTATCYDTAIPSESPSNQPTSSPVDNDAPTWDSCDDENNYFEFIPSDNSSVVGYWTVPTASDANTNDVVTVSNADGYIPGSSSFTPGEYSITYTATDSSGATASSDCVITLFVLGGAESNSYQTCLDDDFSISVSVNSSNFMIMDTTGLSIEDSIEYIGMVSNDELGEDNQNCYVQMTEVILYIDDSAGGSTSVTGELQEFNYWEIIILALGLWVCILTIILIRCICMRKQQVVLDQQKLLAETAAETGDASIYAGIADGHMMRKATLTGGAVVGGVGAQGAGGGGQNARDEMKAGDVELGAITPGQQARASELLANASVVVPTNQPYWQRELDHLAAKGYVDDQRSLRLLIENAVKYAGKIDKSATAKKVEKIFDKEREEQLKANAAKNKVQKEWDNQELDQLNAPQAAIAPPTMSSLADSSNVLLGDDDDDDILKQIAQGDTRKGSYDIPDPMEQGIPPAPVPPPMGGPQGGQGGGRPKREVL